MKKLKQGHVNNRESVGSSLKVGELRASGGGVFSLSQASLRLFAFWHVRTEIVYVILLMYGYNAILHPNPILVFSTLHAVSCTRYSLKYYINMVVIL
jgi:hypothetical protein